MFAQICLWRPIYGAFGEKKVFFVFLVVSQRRHLTQKALQSLMFYNK